MVGGTNNPPLDSNCELWSMKEREKIHSGKEKERALAARKLEVSLDRADAIIEGGRPSTSQPTNDPKKNLGRVFASSPPAPSSRQHAPQHKTGGQRARRRGLFSS